MVCVVQQVEGLDAAAGAEVQGFGHLPADGGLHQRGGSLPDSQHMVVAEDAGLLVRREVAGHPEVGAATAACFVCACLSSTAPAVRPQIGFCPDGSRSRIRAGLHGLARFNKSQRQETLGADPREGGVEHFGALWHCQQPQAYDGGKRRRLRAAFRGTFGGDQRRDDLVAAESGIGGSAKQSGHSVHGVTDAAQVRGEGGKQFREVAARGVGSVAGRKVHSCFSHQASLWFRAAPSRPGSSGPAPPGRDCQQHRLCFRA